MSRPLPGRRGVTLLEMLVASVAGTVILAAFAGLFMTSLLRHDAIAQVAETLSNGATAQDRLSQIALQAMGDRRARVRSTGTGADGLPLWVALAYDRRFGHQPNRDWWYPRIDEPPGGTGGDSEFSTSTGLIFWWRTQWSAVHSRYFDSRLYDIEMPAASLTSVYGQAQGSFVSLSVPQIQAFVNTQSYRQASRVLASDVQNFDVTVNASTFAISWQLDLSKF